MIKKENANKRKHKENKTRTIAFRVTERQYRAYTEDPVMKEILQKYIKACLDGVYLPDYNE